MTNAPAVAVDGGKFKAVNACDYGPDLADVPADYMIANAPCEPFLDGRIVRK